MAQAFLARYRAAFKQKEFRRVLLASLVIFVASVAFIFYAIGYATTKAVGSNYVTDIFLSNTQAWDVGWLFVYGTFLFIAMAAGITVWRPHRLPFALLSLSLFFVIRGIFISITHLAPFPLEATEDPATIFSRIFYGSDQFFSGHTGAPFLFALIYWQYKRWRIIFLAWSLFFATIVLLGHLHYSIDVLAAFFITYAIYHLALQLFPKAASLFKA